FTKPPLAAFSSCDAKFTTTDMARELKTFALFGPPLGRTWDPSPSESARLADIKPLVSNDWTVLRATPPPLQSGEKPKVVDLAARRDGNAGRDRSEDSGDLNPDLSQSTRAERVAAWRGTILPAADSDTWLAAAFADFEPIAGLEKSLSDQPKGRSTPEDDRDRLEVALYAPKSAYLTAVKRLGADMPLAETRADWKRDEWYQIAAGKGTLLLSTLRKLVGTDRFAELMDQFGRAHAGKPVSTADFRAHFEEGAKGKPVAALFDTWLKGKGLPATFPGGTWSINSFEAEPEKALIVYGTRKDSAAQREAAERLQRAIQRHWSNVTVPIKAESDASQDDLASHHLLLIGRPETNGVTRRLAEALPVAFGPASFVVRGQTYAHSASAVIAAGSNPLGDRYSVVVFAGLSAEATWRCAEEPGRRGDQTAEVLILPATGRPHRLVVPPREKPSPVALDARP
ncbi:MAG TPA: hypothetical protein VGY53_04565, partial [Isosphaeraceae bacterium]|nr:hypothetical protein [Isosphaeraceae bacterium]